MSRSDDLHAAAFALTPLVLEKKYHYMKKPFEMLLGGLIIPALVEDDPKVLEEHPEYTKLLERYSKEKVLEFFRVKPATPTPKAPAAKAPEAPKVEPVETTVPKVRTVIGPAAEKIGGKYRRLKLEGVDKVRRFERDLTTNDRDVLILWWNRNQRLVPEDDPVCVNLAKEINDNNPSSKPLSPLQMAGYFSYLCRLGMWPEAERINRITKSINRGRFTVAPDFSGELIEAIVDNYNAEKADEKIRREAHVKLVAVRSSREVPPEVSKILEEEVPVKTATPAPEPVMEEHTPPVATEPVVETETFDIKFAV